MYHKDVDPFPNLKVAYIRVCREKTDSWATVRLPNKMSFEDSIKWTEKELPGWEVVSGCHVNPDELMD